MYHIIRPDETSLMKVPVRKPANEPKAGLRECFN